MGDFWLSDWSELWCSGPGVLTCMWILAKISIWVGTVGFWTLVPWFWLVEGLLLAGECPGAFLGSWWVLLNSVQFLGGVPAGV